MQKRDLRLRISYLAVSLLVILTGACRSSVAEGEKAPALAEYFRYRPDAPILISAHRGGRGIAGYPENCLETLQYVQEQIPNAIFEIDIAQSRDGVLVLLHDDALDRTTNGTDRVERYRYDKLKTFLLEDDFGTLTDFHIPKLTTVLDWADDEDLILMLDLKKSVDLETVLEEVAQAKAQDNVVIITYSMPAARKVYDLDPSLMISVSIRNMDELERAEASGIPWRNIVAFTGTRRSPRALYDILHEKGVKCILGTLGNLDQQAASRGDRTYEEFVAQGVDIFATDRPFAVFQATR